ncbi:MAG TPA: C45 family peptidase [Planctomycetota bacterium]|nr:C45 family peptidase [Planctomycetota bacterium]
MPALLKLPQIHVRGTPAELGRSQGKQLKPLIGAFVEQRLRAAKVYLYERGIRDEQTFRDLGRRCLEALKTWDHEGWVEHMALAEAAGVDAVDLYTTGNMTDIRDILALPALADAEGCTTALVPGSHTADGAVIAAQTWDLNPSDLDYVVAVHRQPTADAAGAKASSPETWSVTCAGCPSLIGMNAHGLTVGTTNIKTRGSRVGIPYLSLLHKAIRCADRATALTTIIDAPRAAAHTYWAADTSGVDDIECTATSHVFRRGERPLTRTNHCQDAGHTRIEDETAASPSSKARLARVTGRLAEGKQTVDSLKQLFADRSDGVNSVNRFAEDQQGTSTNACLIAIPARRELHACHESSDRGE